MHTLAEQQSHNERDVLYLLTDGQQPVWSQDDLGRVLELDEVENVVRGLRQSGLVNQTSDGFVFATRAGMCAVAMIGALV
jgi:hypothetical protein